MTVPRVTLVKPWAAGESTPVQEWERPGRGPAPFWPTVGRPGFWIGAKRLGFQSPGQPASQCDCACVSGPPL